MKIAFLINNINQIGGVEKVVSQLSNFFSEVYNYDIFIYSLYSQDTHCFFTLSKKVVVNNLNCPNHLNNFSLLLRDIYKALKNINTDILITAHADISFCCALLKPFIKGKWILTEHNSLEFYSKKRMILNKYSYRRAHKIIVLSEYAKNMLVQMKIDNVIVIPNAVSFSKPSKNHLSIYKKIIGVGRLEYIKGFDLLIKAFSIISSKFPDWKLVIYGEGTCKRQLEELIVSLKLDNQVILAGSSTEIIDEYDKADIFALSSRDESFGIVLIEAMESSLPIISFEIPVVKEILHDNSIIVEKYNIEQYAKELEKLMINYTYRHEYAKKAKNYAKNYSIDIICGQWKELFEMII